MAVGSTLDPYAALGVPQDAAPAALRSAYKKLMLKCHPDKVRDEAQRAEKAQQFQKVQEAYELLIDPRRRRKYDEELARKGPAAAQAAAANGGSNGAKPTPSTSANPASGGDEGVKKERRRRRHDEEHRRPREETSFDAKDWEERQSYQRRFRKAEEMAEEAMRASARAQYEREQRHKEEQHKHSSSSRHAHGSSTANRYASADEPPPSRKSSYERPPPSQQQHVPHSAPPPQPSSRPPPAQPEPRGPPSETDTEKPAVRPGYEETRAAEDAKIEAVRRRLRETQAGLGSPRTQRSNSHEEDPYVKSQTRATMDHRQQQVQAERSRMEQERLAREKSEQRKARQAAKEPQSDHSERSGRATDTPANRPRKVSASPMGPRRASSSVSRDEFATTPPFATKPPMNGMSSGSVPTTSFYGSPPHVGGPGYPQVRRRHSLSSPSPDKQNSRLQRDQQASCDSGYSSPSPNNDTTPSCTFEKKHVSSNLNPTPSPTVPKADGSTIHPRDSSAQSTPGWKKFIVYVQEDGETTTAPIDARRKSSSSGIGGSPDSQHAEPAMSSEGPPLPPDFFVKAAGSGLAGGSTFFVTSSGAPPPNPYGGLSSNYAGSHTGSHSSHSSPRQPPIRHHSVHYHPHPSPKMGEPIFVAMPSPQLSRASTTTGSRRTAPSEGPYGFQAPVFTRSSTWGGP